MLSPMADSVNAIDFMAFPSLITRPTGELLVSFYRARVRLNQDGIPTSYLPTYRSRVSCRIARP
jgi:hypothetical protein